MSETMRPLSFAQLMTLALNGYQANGSLFGVHELYRHAGGKTLPIFNEKLETPFGPAAGPHTQMAQNLLAAYAGGSRFFEVKTVQKMDGPELAKCIARPCILARDEGYNVEWSTELTVPQAFAEYVKAYFAMKLLSAELGLGSPDGFVFNMSVGYDLAGIRSEKIDRYINGMVNAEKSDGWLECREWALNNLSRFTKIDKAFVDGISPKISDSITLSTLHGCPPEEIERIATYLISQKRLNTFIKCNPTLLGYDFARQTMDAMGYDELVFDDHHFKDDLRYGDAVPMFMRLTALAAEKGVAFGVKLTNTFPVGIAKGELPGEEMYMSGKGLYPLTVALAAKLEKDFEGKLRVSYSGGADAFNIGALFDCGIWPITMATTLLKTGGYNRLKQMAELLAAKPYAPFSGVDRQKLDALAKSALHDPHHVKPIKTVQRPKADRKAPLTDCFIAGCEETCPIHQDIPAYLKLVGEGRYAEALAVICQKNPLPFITGTICNHRCQSACARCFYEEPVHIRAMKLMAAQKGFNAYLTTLKPTRRENAPSIAVIGGGPGGMAAAFLAARAGAAVTLFEKRESLGGVVRHVIPAFRIPGEAIDHDEQLLRAVGVAVKLNTEITTVDEVKAFDHVLLAVGAWEHTPLKLEEGEAMNVIDFLEAAKKTPDAVGVQGNVIVVGGGNTAMDAARAAKRLPGVKSVTVVYRRQVRQMPAELEELEPAKAEGIDFKTLLSPVTLQNGRLQCEVMRLGEPGADGRRRPEPTGQRVQFPADAVISAIGEKPSAAVLAAFADRAVVIGDAKRGPATVVEAIADATEAVERLLGVKPSAVPVTGANNDTFQKRRGVLCHAQGECDSDRCLGCSEICESCVDVCPNRANWAVQLNGRDQVLHIDRLCNECGNCAAFCPYGGEPYHDKLTAFSTAEDFENSPHNQGFLRLENGRYRVRLQGKVWDAALTDGTLEAPAAQLIQASEKALGFLF